MKIKHLIITRFMSDQFNHTDEELFNNNFLAHSFDMLKRHLLRSLSIQTCKDFELVILIHNRIPDDKISFIYEIQNEYDFKIIIVRKSELEGYVQSFKDRYDFIITSRMDYDDHIHKSVVEEVQSIPDTNYAVQLYGLNNGVTIIDGETEAHFMSMDYGKAGYFSVFETLVINAKMINIPFSIYHLGNHCTVCRTIRNEYARFGIPSVSSIKIERSKCKETRYIWTRHKNSQIVQTRGEYHKTDKIVNGLNLADFGYTPTIK